MLPAHPPVGLLLIDTKEEEECILGTVTGTIFDELIDCMNAQPLRGLNEATVE
jgi:hypothetical protein